MSAFPPNSESAFEKAKANDLVVVEPEAHQLQIDIDDSRAYEIFSKNQAAVNEHFGIVGIEEHASKSGGDRKHVTVTLAKPVMSNMERILLQACLGSDGVRELLSYVQVLNRDPHPILFLEKQNART